MIMKLKDLSLKIGSRIREIRKMNKIKVKALCEVLGVAAPTYYAYESDETDVTASVLIKLAAFYRMSVDDLIGNKVSINRTNATSFKNYGEGDDVLVIDQTKDDIFMYAVDEFNIWYFQKSSAYNYNHKVLISENGEYYPAILNYDKNENLYIILDLRYNYSKIMKPQAFKDTILVHGFYAGAVKKEITIDNFL